jgi:protein-disulfide isomerase
MAGAQEQPICGRLGVNGWKKIAVAAECLALALIGVWAAPPLRAQSSGSATPTKAQTTKALSSKSAAAKFEIVETAPVKTMGSKSAPITLEVFSDFQCPSCRMLYQGTLRQVFENYVSTGKVYFIHRDFPLPMHKYSREAARYANAAARIGKFEPVAAALFAKQDFWAENGQVDAVVASALTPAEMTKVRQLVKEEKGRIDADIEKDVALGQGNRVSQTPTSIITSRGQTYPVVGVVDYPILRQFLDELLKR